jgi:co-chaperonin GroES (HSP10)
MTEYIPLNDLILIRQDDEAEITRGGIVLPDSVKKEEIILTGRVVSISEDIKDCDKLGQVRFEELDKVLYDPRKSFPASLETGNKMFLVHFKDVLAIVRDKS